MRRREGSMLSPPRPVSNLSVAVVEDSDGFNHRLEFGRWGRPLAKPVEHHPVVAFQERSVILLQRRRQGRVALVGEVHQQQVELQHSASAAPADPFAIGAAGGVIRLDGLLPCYTFRMVRTVESKSRVPNLAALQLAGADAAAFLQGYLTADTREIEPDTGLPMAWCTLKGRVLANGWVAGTPEAVTLVLDASVADSLEREMRKYLLFSRSKLESAALPGDLPLPPADCRAGDDAQALADACAEASVVVVNAGTSESFLPQMIGLTDIGAVNFAKGCYLGQEVVARAQHRGEVKVRLRRYAASGAPPAIGDDVHDGERRVGTVVGVGAGLVLAATRSESACLEAADGARLTLAA